MKRLTIAALAVCVTALGGCGTLSVLYDEDGNGVAALTLTETDAEPRTGVDRGLDKAADAAGELGGLAALISPQVGGSITAAGAVLAALGYGSKRGRKATEEKHQAANAAWDESEHALLQKMAMLQAQPAVTNTEVQA